MECNKDEAIRAKQLAEKKLTEEDISGAKRFALKARNLFPGLEGLSQFQETIDVYASCQKRVNGEIDWYEILGVDPLADNETIRKKYRKLALALHPDKNKSVGADGAFKIISEAWGLLSDKAKRDAFNKRRNIGTAYQRARDGNPPPCPGKSTSQNFTHCSSKPRNPTAQEKSQNSPYQKGKAKTSSNNAGKNGYNSSTNSSSSTKNPASQGKPQQETRPSYQKAAHQDTRAGDRKSEHSTFSNGCGVDRSKTFWTSCEECRMHYEFVCIYLNKKLRCPTCQKSFKAREMPPPPPHSMGKRSSTKMSYGQKQQEPDDAENSYPFRSTPCGVNRSKTFWTSCKGCMMHYEYVHIYRNKKLLCPTCRKPFIAIEMLPQHSIDKRFSTEVPCRQKPQGPIDNSFDTRNESNSVTPAGQQGQNFQSNNVNLKRPYEQEVVDVTKAKKIRT